MLFSMNAGNSAEESEQLNMKNWRSWWSFTGKPAYWKHCGRQDGVDTAASLMLLEY